MDRVCHKAGLNHRDLVMGSCGEYMRRPAHFVALDHRRRAIVVVIRGTQGAESCCLWRCWAHVLSAALQGLVTL